MGIKRVLVTGASGYVASQILPMLRQHFDVVLVDASNKDKRGNMIDGVQVADLLAPARDSYAHLFENVDAVVHLAWAGPGGGPWEQQKTNLDLTYNVMQTAYEAGASRFVMSSGNSADVWYETELVHDRKLEILDPHALPAPDNFYGWAKVCCEQMSFLYASGAFGRKMGAIMIRICSPREIDVERFRSNPGRYKRFLGSHVSQRDLSQLFLRAISAEHIENEHGVPWHVVYGVSNNTRSFYSLANARQVLGYHPEDDSEVKYARDIYEFLTGDGATAGPGRLGK